MVFGLPGQGMNFAADPLSLLFLLLLLPQVLAAAIAGMKASPTYWVFVVGIFISLLAADAFTLIFGFELMSAASWFLVLRGDRKPATLYIATAMFSAACLIPALFIPASALAFLLVFAGAGAKAGLAPLYSWLPLAHPAPPAAVSAVMSGGMVKVALYILVRYAFVVLAPASAPWWGILLIAAGAVSVFIGALRAMLETEMKILLACSTVEHVGLISTGLGIALYAKAMGDVTLAAMAMQAALLCAVCHALYKPMLFIGAGVVKQTAGTTSLNELGGLLRGMPVTGIFLLLGAAGMAGLPLGPGFAPILLLLHAVMKAAGTGGILARIGFTALLAVLGMAEALALGAAVRLVGIGFLGRPRSLRAAAAAESGPAPRVAMGVLAVGCALVAMLPGAVLLFMQPVVTLLIPGAAFAGLGYQPVMLLLLLAFCAVVLQGVLYNFGTRGEQETETWNGGFGAAPAWLPFGEPATQPSATGFAEPVFRAIASTMLPRGGDAGEILLLVPLARLNLRLIRVAEYVRRATLRQRLAVVFAALVMFLLALGLITSR
jgi:formate hydrogenlyase subunit 3/multisubunit Na+/H+ antiporter MnhD subunit